MPMPIVQRKPANQFDNFYFCVANVKGFNENSKQHVQHPDLPSAIRSIAHCQEIHTLVSNERADEDTPEIADEALSTLTDATDENNQLYLLVI